MKTFLDSDWLRGVQFLSQIALYAAQALRVQINKTRADTGNESKFNMVSNLVPRARDLQEKNRELWDNP